MLKIIQINLNNSKLALDNLKQKMMEDQIELKRKLCRDRKRKGRGMVHTIGQMELEYGRARKEFRRAIAKAKKEAWCKLIGTLENDVWGLPYKILRGKIIKGIGKLSREDAARIIKEMFPKDEKGMEEKDRRNEGDKESEEEVGNEGLEEVTEEEMVRIAKTLKNRKAPGSDEIPNEIIKIIIKHKMEDLRKLINRCFKEKRFPERWKVCKVVLIPKGGQNSGKYRPICLINTMGKVLEKIIEKRLQAQVKNLINIRQYGFREGKGTIDALEKVVDYIKEGMDKGLYTIAISIDIRNAFNSACWGEIMKELERLKVTKGLRQIIYSYLSNRKGVIETEEGDLQIEINRGVPQGSVLGPLLWNIVYNRILNWNEGIEDKMIICYADDTLMLVRGKKFESTRIEAQDSINQIVTNIEELGLEVEPDKSEMVYFTKRRLKPRDQRNILIKGRLIEAKKSMKYLGLVIDDRMNFKEHIKKAWGKTAEAINNLGPILKNLEGPKQLKRRLLASVGQAIFLYGAPIWAPAIQKGENKKLAVRASRLCALRVASAYRTVSNAAVHVISGIPPMNLIARKRMQVYKECKEINGKDKDRIRKRVKRTKDIEMMEEWQREWEEIDDKAKWTREVIPDIRKWLKRKYGEVDYYITQALSGHGAFNWYLKKFKKRSSEECRYCGKIEDVKHVIFECAKWEGKRGNAWATREGDRINQKTMLKEMLRSKERWIEIGDCIRSIIREKEEEDRMEGY
ncbi:Putative 115 kDa protein in type-1 retrotransposable element R1DM [Anthophora retusa]